jgi:hypothetical protein
MMFRVLGFSEAERPFDQFTFETPVKGSTQDRQETLAVGAEYLGLYPRN